MKLFDNSKHEMTIENGCPWYEAQQAYGAPNVNWCEKTVCSIINEPANTWSNLGFLIVALVIFMKFKQPLLKFFSAAVLFMGSMSFVYHATNNYLTQFVDFIGMNIVSSFLIAFGLIRLLKKENSSFLSYFWFFAFLNTAFLILMDITKTPLQLIFILQYLIIFILELYIGLETKQLKHYYYFALSILLIAVAQTAAQFDLKRVYCNVENLFVHGHVAWHLVGALAMYFAALHVKKVLELNSQK